VIKKRAMSMSKFVNDFTGDGVYVDTLKRLDVGYADNQPKWPYWVRPCNYDIGEWQDMNQWMFNTMGDNNWLTENARWVGSNSKYWFRDEQDRTMFILRWS